MTDIAQQIAEIEKEIRETPYHKGTEHHIGKLRARLAKLRDREIESGVKSAGGGGGGYAVRKEGDATVVLIGPPSAGKSTLINRLTNAESKVAPYAFTTVTVIPGMFKYNDAYIQILDVPGLIEGAKEGKGRGREILSIARGADLLLIMTDVKRINFIEKMVKELEGAGVRINQFPPGIFIDRKLSGGIDIRSNIRQDIDKETIKEIVREFGIKNGDITIREKLTYEKLFDGLSSNRVYIPAIFAVNKIDTIRRQPTVDHYLYFSAQNGDGVQNLIDNIWKSLKFVTVYLVRPEEGPNKNNPIIMKKNQTLKDVALKIGTEFAEGKKFAKIWEAGAKFPGQEVSLSIQVQEGMQIRFL